MMEDLKHHFHFHSNHISSFLFTHLLTINQHNKNNIHYGRGSFKYTADLQATSTFPFHFHFYTYCLDADGLKYIIVSHSQYNLVTNDMQSKDNYFIPVDQPITDIPSDVINLFICGYDKLFDQSIFLHSFSKLQTIVIGSNCFNHVREFVIDGLTSLESVKIGEYSLGRSRMRIEMKMNNHHVLSNTAI